MSRLPPTGPLAVAPLAALLAVALFAAPVQATKGPPVELKILPPALGQLPVQGQNYAVTLRVTSAVAATVQDFAFSSGRLPGGGYAWSVVSIGIPPGTQVPLQPMVPLDVACVLAANDPTKPVELSVMYNGHRVAHTVLLLPRYGPAGILPLPSTVKFLGAPPSLRMAKSAYAVPAPHEVERPPRTPAGIPGRDRSLDAARTSGKRDGYDIRVHGCFVYTRPDGRTAGVDGCTVRVMDEDWDWDEELAVVCTGPDGTFDVTFSFDESEDPDIYLELEAANSKVQVEDASVFEWNYTWRSHVEENTTATDIDFHTFTTEDESLAPALHILTTATRTYRWFLDCDSQVDENISGIHSVDIQWPEDGVKVSRYTEAWETIEINSDAQWQETTVAHEYNHHMSEHFYPDHIDNYCNDLDRCDDDDCHHCLWCQESADDAWGEGFGDFVGASLARLLEPVYGLPPVFTDPLQPGNYYNTEYVHDCDQGVSPPQWDDPTKTEGNVAGFLLDIEDDNNQAGTHYGGHDELTMWRAYIVGETANNEPPDVMQFITDFVQLHPEIRNNLWNTALLHGYSNLDNAPPGVVTNLTSSTHPVNCEVTSHYATITWTTAPDDWSGISGYSVLVSHNATDVPDYTEDIGNTFTYTTGDVGTGSSYFTIRAHDRAGHWSSSIARYGPMVVRAAFSADVRPWPDTGWDYALVPRPAADATTSEVPAPTTLAGNAASTYWNLSVQNIGEEAAPYGWRSYIYLDGSWYTQRSLPTNLPSGSYQKWINQGPMTVRGGRHMFSVKSDPLQEYSEMNEFDNDFARQWIWTPLTLSNNTAYTRSAPPDRFGGALSWNMFYSYNCDGLRSSAVTGPITAVSVRALDDAADYDCRLHEASSDASSGFATMATLGWSARAAGRLDAVLMPSNLAYDVGVISMNDHWADYVAVKTVSTSLTFNSSSFLSLAAGMYLRVLHFDPVTAQNITITVSGAGATPLHVAWLNSTFTTGDIDDANAQATTDSTGFAQIGPVDAAAGYNGIVIWRDPIDAAPGGGTAPYLTFTVRAFPTPSDLTPNTPSGWAHACVPRPATDGTPTSVPMPSSLPGDAASTYANTAWCNAGPNTSTPYYSRVDVDGVQRLSVLYAALSAGAAVTANSHTALTVPGGRHMFSLRLDPDNTVPEISDANNNFGRQWVWTPATLVIRTPAARTIPPDPTGGLADAVVDTSQTVYYNCDGVRMPAPTFTGQHGYWQAVATMPGAASDVDLRLHEASSNATAGFRDALVASNWSLGQSDFVLANYRATTPARAFDIGVTRVAGTENYTVEAVASTYTASFPDGTYGPYNLSASHILNLHEVKLRAGPIAISLREVAGGVDWGLSLHMADRAFQAKMPDSGQEGWIAWMSPAGGGDSLVVDLPVSGLYCLAVWKAKQADLAKNGQYQLLFDVRPTGSADVLPPAVSVLTGVHPNPFNPLTTVTFDVGRGGRVRLAVFDLAGRRVRDLFDADVPAGRRACMWDGLDDHGRPSPSGVYIVRLIAPDGADRRRVTLVR